MSSSESGEDDMASRMPTSEENFLSKCNCQLRFFEPKVIAYEDENVCTKDRKYFDSGFRKIPQELKEVRNPFPEADVPRECLVLVMKSFMSSGQSARSNYFANCQHSIAAPQRKVKIHCMHKTYVNAVYNAFVDVADCLNLQQKDLLAQFANESGFHINTFGMGGDTGIGQLTGDAIAAVLEPYWKEGGRIKVRDYYLAEIGKSTKPSCQRIIDYPAAFQVISDDVNKRCSLINPPENPYRNMLYTGIYYRTLMHNVAGIRFVAGKDFIQTEKGLEEVFYDDKYEPGGRLGQFQVKRKLKALGLKNPDLFAVTRALTMLSYNTGPTKATEYLKTYLDKRIEEKKWLSEKDVNFLLTDFLKPWIKATGGRAMKVLPPELAKARRAAHGRPFPEFLTLVQESGAPGYISRVAEKHKELIVQMGDERCVNEDYLQF